MRVVALGAAALLFAEPVFATTCDEKMIADMSVDEVAQMIWARSEVIGFGYISTVDTPEREQQFIDMAVSLKGAPNQRYAFAPLRIGRTGWNGPGLYRLQARPDEVVFVTLLRTEQGYITPDCRNQAIAKDRVAIIRRLAAISQHRR